MFRAGHEGLNPLKEISAEFLRQEVVRLGELVVETAIYHESGMKLFAAGDTVTREHAKALHVSGIQTLYLLEFDEDAQKVRKMLGVQKVAGGEILEGDVLMDDLRTGTGELIYASGMSVTPEMAERIRAAVFVEVTIRDRRLADSMRRAQEYFAQLAPDPRSSGTTRVTRVVHVPSTTARYLLIPRARVLVPITDDPLRIFVSNALQSEGHEVLERPSPKDAVEVAMRESRVTVIVLDLDEAMPVLPKLRAESDLREAVILVCVREGKQKDLHAALLAGANDWLPRPPSRDLLAEKIHGCQALVGRKVKLAPSLRTDRRKLDRRAGAGECTLKDPALSKPLPVVSGGILDLGDGGLKIDYNMPAWPNPWAYMVHGVHPKHFFYTYAWSNPRGRDLTVVLPGPAGPVERAARVSMVHPAGELESLGLLFPEVKARTTSSSTRKF